VIVIFSKANDNSVVGCEDHAEDGLVDVDDL